MRAVLVGVLLWVVGVPLFVFGVAGVAYALEEIQWRRDIKRGEQRLLLLVARVDDDGPPHERRH